jgi:hypothetical protein
MIRQYLSNTNESATVSIFQKILELNKAETTITKAPVVSIVLAPFMKGTTLSRFTFIANDEKDSS